MDSRRMFPPASKSRSIWALATAPRACSSLRSAANKAVILDLSSSASSAGNFSYSRCQILPSSRRRVGFQFLSCPECPSPEDGPDRFLQGPICIFGSFFNDSAGGDDRPCLHRGDQYFGECHARLPSTAGVRPTCSIPFSRFFKTCRMSASRACLEIIAQRFDGLISSRALRVLYSSRVDRPKPNGCMTKGYLLAT